MAVGWINSRTGKGGLDDYFLAGEGAHGLKCDDGAESCPDTSKEVCYLVLEFTVFASSLLLSHIQDVPHLSVVDIRKLNKAVFT